LAGLDGLRALAVAGVITYHVHSGWLPGGYIGVDVFFGISGFLITHLLLGEQMRAGRIALGGFWRRRAVRLLPELLLVLVAGGVTARLTAGDGTGLGDGLRGDAASSLGFVNNWWQIHEGDDYFHHLGTPPLLQHLWSLGVEEQFYLVWPLLLAVVLPLARGRRQPWLRTALGLAAAGGAVASLWRMRTVGHGTAGVARAYFGTDTHSGALLAGCAAALLLPALDRVAGRLPRRGLTAVRSGLGVLAVFAFVGPGDKVMYGWGFAAVAVATTAVCAGCAVGAPVRFLDARPLRALGRHSYGLYLWHWPVVVALNTLWPAPDAAVRVVELVAPLPLAVAGRQLVQRPVALRMRAAARVPRPTSGVPLAAAGAVAAALALVLSPVSAPSALQSQLQAAARYEAGLGDDGSPRSPAPVPASPSATGAAPGSGAASAPAGSDPSAGTASAPPGTVDGSDVTLIGDSVSLGSDQDLHRLLPGVDVHAQVGRMMEDAPDICRQLLAEGRLRGTVVLALGTNGEFGPDVLDDIRSVIGGRRMVLMTVRGPFSWQDSVNSVVRTYQHDHPEVLVDDWYDAVAPHLDLLWIDHVHPRGGAGTTLFASSLEQTLAARPAA
jgi:peptidoglycan/LPS O-acetylase OafA/YrhL